MRKIIFLILLSGVFILASCNNKEQPAQQQGAMTYPIIKIPVRTVTGYTSYPVSIQGTVSSAVRAKVPGYITNVFVDEGEKVIKGQVLFKLETEALSQDAGAAKANVNAARVEVEKLKPLVEKGIISNVQLETAKARLEQAKANYSSIAANIGYATIKSPVDGFVGSVNFREGALVSPNDSKPLTTVSDIEDVYAFFSMNETSYLDFLQNTPGGNLSEKIDNFPPVQLELVNGSTYLQNGKIETISGQVDPSTGTVSFRAIFPNPNQLLASGNSGKIRIPRTYEEMPVVPQSASFEQQGRVYVYRVQGDSMAVSTPISVQDRVDNLLVVESGIEHGNWIVAQGVGKLRNNTAIVPQRISFDSIEHAIKPVFK